MTAILKEDMNKMTCRICCSDRIDKGFIPFSVAESLQPASRYKSSIWSLFDLNGTEPWLVSLETPVLTQVTLANMAAVKKVC